MKLSLSQTLQLAVLALTIAVGSTALLAAERHEANFFVAPDGNDAWSGRLPAPNVQGTDGPFAAVERAREAVRELKALDKRAGRRPRDIVVMLRGGQYVLDTTLVFTPEDSGVPRHPVVYTAYPGETPVISSARRIAGWQKGDGELWVARVPRGWYFTQLFVNGEMKIRSREPDTDNWREWWKVTKAGQPEPDAPKGQGSRELYFPPGTLENWENLGDIEINGLPAHRYANFICPLAQVDEATSMATLTAMAYYNFKPGDPFRVENVLAALDQPGEWCVNTQEGMVYYWPEEGERMERAEVIAPALTKLVRFQGDEEAENWVHDITLRGLTFTHCDRVRWHELPAEDEGLLHNTDSAVYLEGTERCGIENCRFVDVAAFGVRFNLTSRGNRFVGNEVVGAGGGGVLLGGYGPGTKDVNKGNIIAYNHIHHSAVSFWHAPAINLRQSGNNYIGYNYVHNMPYGGIMMAGAKSPYFKQYHNKGPGVGRAKYNFRWDEIPEDNPLTRESVKPFLHARNNIVEYNVVHDVLEVLPADGGALYGYSQGLGNVFRNNLVYRAHCVGIYLDGEFDGVRVENNIVYDCGRKYFGNGTPTAILGENFFYDRGQEPASIRLMAMHMTRLAAEATGPQGDRKLRLLWVETN